jgi:hypothetical protein
MASLMQLQSHVAALRHREAELEAELQEALHAPPPLPPPPKVCTSRTREVALRIFALADLSVDKPLKYLSKHGRTVCEGDVRGWYSALSADSQSELRIALPGDELGLRRLEEAQAFLRELQLVSWVREQNASKGVAPTSTLILEQAGPDLLRSCRKQNQFRWVRRCMTRWGGHRARFGHGDQLSQEEFREKARPDAQRLFALPWMQHLVYFAGHLSSPFSGLEFGPSSCSLQ